MCLLLWLGEWTEPPDQRMQLPRARWPWQPPHRGF